MIDENLIATLADRGVITETVRRLPVEKKTRLYETAIRLFGEYGYDGLSVDRYCRDAGISKGSFFQYFPSKSHLLEYALLIFDDRLAQWVADIKAGDRSGRARDRLLYLYQSLVADSRLRRSEEDFYHFIVKGVHHAAVAVEGIDLTRHLHAYITDIIERGETTGEIRGDFDPGLTTHLVATLIDGAMGQQYAGTPLPQRQTGEYLMSLMFDGIKA